MSDCVPYSSERIPSEVACSDSLVKETSRLNGNSRIRAILCFSSLKDSGGGEIFGEGLELEQLASNPARASIQMRFNPRAQRNTAWDPNQTRTSTYFSIMITGNPDFASRRACSSASLRLEKVPN